MFDGCLEVKWQVRAATRKQDQPKAIEPSVHYKRLCSTRECELQDSVHWNMCQSLEAKGKGKKATVSKFNSFSFLEQNRANISPDYTHVTSVNAK